MVKLVIFDFWGTLMENGVYPSPVRQVKYILRIEGEFGDYIQKFEDIFMLKEYDDLKTAFQKVSEAFGKKTPDFVYDKLVGMWNKHKLLAKPFKETEEVLKKLKKEGYMIALISNSDCFSLNEVLDKYNLREYFDDIILSYEVGMLKTNPEMFHNILAKLNVEKSEAIMIGDSIESDMNGAKDAGIKAVLVDRRDRREFNPKIKTLDGIYEHLE